MQDPGLLFLELGAVVLGLSVVARAAKAVGFSPIPLYLIVGLAVGEGGVVDLEASEEFITVGAEIGVVLLLLLLGLEFPARELVTQVRRLGPSGIWDALLNFTPGMVAGLILGWGLVAAALLGGVTYISSSGVIAKLLADLNRLGNRETPLVLGILVIEDLAMALYLPVMAAVLVGGGFADVATPVAVALCGIVIAFAIALRFGDRVASVMLSESREVMLLGLLGLTFLVAGVADRLELSTAVGAFLVGITLAGSLTSQARDLLLPLRNLFAAVFFVFFGLELDPGLIPGVAVTASALAVVTMGTKIVTGWMAGSRVGLSTPARLRLGTALVARGEFSIVIAALGTAIEPDLAALAAAYVVFLAVVGPVLARFADPLARLLANLLARRRTTRRRPPDPAGPEVASRDDGGESDR